MTEGRGAVLWRKSGYSGTSADQQCCEVAVLPGEIRTRDSKCPDTAALRVASRCRSLGPCSARDSR
ncbi:DUF397 domain-containing protein [Streptomyces sp. PRKS01-65]|nr:DUF397 domain-containing protein [Streptomyces harenosi]